MDFTDIASRYLQNRFDQATQPFTDPSGYMENRMGVGGETEEERRKRLAREQAQFGNTEIGSTTVKNYADGSQEEITKRQVPAPVAPEMPAAPQPVAQVPEQIVAPAMAPVNPQQPMPMAEVNPLEQPPAPTVIPKQLATEQQRQIDAVLPPAGQGPAAPTMVQPQPAPVAQAPMPVAQPVQPAPVAQAPAPMAQPVVAPAVPEARPIISDQGQVLGRETPEQMVAGAQTNAPVAMAPVNPEAPVAQPVVAPAPQAAPAPVWSDRLTNAKTSDDYKSIMIDPNTPDDIRRVAAGAYSKSETDNKKREDAERKIAEMSPTDLTRAMRSNKEEGSYIKAILFARLGLNELAKEEQQKLGAGAVFQSVVGTDGQRYTAEIGGQGEINRAFDATGKAVNNKTIAELNANAIASKGIGHAGATRIRDSEGKEWSVVPTTRGSIFYDSTGRPGVPKGTTVPIAVGSDVDLAAQMAFIKGREGVRGRGAGEGFDVGPAPSGRGTGDGFSSSLASKVISGERSTAEQRAIYDESVAAGRPGVTPQGYPIAKPGTSPHETDNARDIKNPTKNERRELAEKGWYQPNPAVSPNHWERQGPPPTTTSTGAVIPNPNAPAAIPSAGGIAQQRQQLEISGKRSEAFNKIIDTEYRENGQKGEVVSSNRKQQFDILNQIDPTTGKGMAETISGLYTAANENPNNQKLTIIRDILTGKALPEQDASKRIAELNISPAAKSALQQYNGLNAQIAAMTLKETAGPGSVSDAEQQANRARNVDITRAPMLGAYNMMSQSQFSADVQRYKSDLSSNTTAPNATAFDRDFRKYQQELTKAYRDMAEARLDYINKNGGANNPNAIRQGYKLFPTPEYDPGTGEWKHKKPLTQIFGK